METNLSSIGMFTCISFFISNFVLKYADSILMFIFEYTMFIFGYFISFSNDNNDTREFDYLLNYISNNALCLKRKPKYVMDNETYLYYDLNINSNKEQFHNHVYNGPFYLQFKNNRILGYYKCDSGAFIGNTEKIYKRKTIQLFAKNNKVIKDLINESRDSYKAKQQNIGLKYKYSVGNQRWAVWKNASFNIPKTIDFSKSKSMTKFENNIKEFLESKQDYIDMNIPYKKTFLITGPPGTGKSRFTKSVARTYNIPAHEASIGSGHISDTSLKIL